MKSKEKKEKKDWRDIEDDYERYKAYLKSDDWKKVQEKVLERFDNHCAFCGRDNEQLYIHHNTYKYLGDELNHLDCVVATCKVCHIALHRVKRNWTCFSKPKKTKDS